MTQPHNPSEPNSNPTSPENVNPGVSPSDHMNASPSSVPPPMGPTTFQPVSDASQGGATQNTSEAPASQALETGKATVSDAVTALKQLHQDPHQGIVGALESLGETRAFNVGIALCLLFPIAVWSAIVRGIGTFLSFFGGLGGFRLFDLDAAAHLKGLISSGIPAIALILGLMAIRALFNARGTVKQFTFVAGICLLPLSINFFLLWLLGVRGLELSGLFGIFSASILVLLLNSSLTGVMGLSAKKSLWLVPTLLVAVVFVTQVMLDILY